MATVIFMRRAFDDFTEHLEKIAGMTDEIAKQALYVGAGIYADEMKRELRGVLSERATGQLVDAFGITPIKQTSDFDYTVHLGFDGYQVMHNGKRVPYQLIARAINSGAYKDGKQIIAPTHFAQTAVSRKKKDAQRAMQETVERLINQQIGG